MSAVTSVPATAPATEPSLGKPQSDAGDYTGFLALLAINSVQAQQADGLGPQAVDTRPQNARQAPAAETPRPTSQPSDTLAAPEAPKPRASTAQETQTSERKSEKTEQAQPTVAPRQADKSAETQTNQDKPETESEKLSATSEAKKSSTDQDVALDELAEKQKKIREALGEKLESLDLLLTALIQALALSSTSPSGEDSAQPQLADAAAQASLPATSPQTATAEQLLALLTAAPQADAAALSPEVAALTPSQASAGIPLTDAQAAAPDASLLKDIRALLQNLQRTLQSVDRSAALAQTNSEIQNAATPTPTTTTLNSAPQQTNASAATSSTPLSQLQQQLAALVQKLAPESNAHITVRTETDLAESPAPTASTSITQIFAAVKETIGSLRDQLKSLQQENEQSFAPVKNALQAQFEKAQEFFRSAAADNAASVASAAAGQQSIADTATAAAAIPEQLGEVKTPAIIIAPAPTLTVGGSAIALPAPTAAGSDLGSNSGSQQQGQQQTQAQGISASGQSSATEKNASTTGSDFSRSLQRATPQLLGEQVAFQVRSALSNGTSKIRIQLDPADLGKIDIKLTVEAGGKTGVSIMVDSRHTLDMLQRDAQGLARALADAGLTTDGSSLSFNLRGEGQGQQGQGENTHAASTYRKAQPDEEIIEPLRTATAQSYIVNPADGLDIHI